MASDYLTKTSAQPILFVDISELAQRDSKTGIQRVVRSIVNALLTQGVDGYRVEFIYASIGGPYRYAHMYMQQLRGFPTLAVVDTIVDPQAGDIFMGLDFQSIVVPLHAAFLQAIRAKGIKVYFVVYDLLPVLFRNYFAPSSFANHNGWLNTVTQSDGAICISQSVAIELEEWLKSSLPIRRDPFDIGWFHLGADVEASQPSRGLAVDAGDTLRELARRPTFLLVGTIEPRKGQAQALGAFQLLWQRGIDVNLVLVGQQGWMVEKLISDLRKSPELGKRLFFLKGISDEYLEKIYAASSCLIAASEGEGFGLPLVEAAQHKLPIIARDIPVFREVAGKHAFYFAGLAPLALADAVVAWLALYKSGLHPKSDELPSLTWSQSTAQLLDVVLNNKWSARWISDGRFRCAGSDPRLQTQVGMKRGLSIQTTGVEGVFLYGPYLALPAGEYQIKLYGQIKKSGVRTLELVATVDFGKKVLSAQVLDASRDDGLIVEMDISIAAPVSAFEVCLWVSADDDISIDTLEVVLRAPIAIRASDKSSSASNEYLDGENILHTPKPKTTQGEELQALLLEEGDEFIDAAFMALLKRRPDANGGRTYLRALRSGTSKLQILYELSMSDDCRRVGGEIAGLSDACARAGIGEANDKSLVAPPAEVAQVTRAEQLLVIVDMDKFIELAYWVLLKRPPDAEGIANCRGRLQGGAGKAQVLYELFTSSECREMGIELPGLRDAFTRESLHVVDEQISARPEELPTTATTLAELLGYQGGRFVDCAYMTLLKRAPDGEGFQHRLEQLLGGAAKIQILSEMSASKEAIAAGVNLPGLSAALTRYKFSQTPIVGRLVKVFVNVEGNSAAERRGRAAEQRLLTLAAEAGERLTQLEKSSGRASLMEQESLAARASMDARIASLEKSVTGLRQLIEQSARTFSVSEELSSDVASTQSSSRLALDLRVEEIARDLRRVQ